MRTACLLSTLALGTGTAAADLSGRWEGAAAIPGAPLQFVVDVAPSGAGPWGGSVILPGRAVAGAALADLAVDADGLRASVAAAFGGAPAQGKPPSIALRLQPDGTLAGSFELGGLAAPLTLARTGPPQVTPPPPRTPVSAALAGTWRGSYDLGGHARQVTLTLTAGAPGKAELVIVGKRTTPVPIDRYAESDAFVTLESAPFGITIEGRWRTPDGAIRGTFTQGPFEVPLVLRRGAAS